MANTVQAKKRAKQAEKHRVHNAALRSGMRTSIKKVTAALATGTKEVATTAFQKMSSSVDKMVTKGLIHKNKAARHKSRLSAKLKSLSK